MSSPIVPTAEVIALLNRDLGRPTAALRELLSILHDSLPPVLVERSLPAIRGYYIAGEDVGSNPFPCLIVSAAVAQGILGTGVETEMEAVITCAIKPVAAHIEVERAMDTIHCVLGVLWHPNVRFRFKTVTEGEESYNAVYWHELLPTRQTPVPGQFKDYGGYSQHFRLLQAPQSKLWET